MEIALDRKEDNYGIITISINDADYQDAVDQQLRELRKKANLKGFRPGKVPLNFIKRMYGKDVKADSLTKTVNDRLYKYINEDQLVLFMPIQKSDALTPEEISERESFTFEFEVCLAPEFSYKLDSGISIERPVLDAVEEDVDATIGRIKEQLPVDTEVEEVTKGDFVSGTYKQVEGDFESVAMLPTNQLSEEALPLFEGKKVGDKVTFNIEKALPEENQIKNLFTPEEGQLETIKGEFEVEIETITRKSEPEMNQEFFDRAVGPDKVSSEEEFRAEIKKQINEANQGYANSVFESLVRDEFVETMDITLPEEFLKRIMQVGRETPLSEEEVIKQLPGFVRAAKWQAITNRIANDADLKVTQEEVMATARQKVKDQFAQMGLAGLSEEQLDPIVESVLEREEGKKTIEEAQREAFDKKIMDHIAEHIQVTDKTYSAKEFEEYVNKLNEEAEAKLKAEEEASAEK